MNEKLEKVLNSGIEVLDLSVRAYNCLRRANIRTIGELLKRSEDDLMKVRNLGKNALEETLSKLAGFLKDNGYELHDYLDDNNYEYRSFKEYEAYKKGGSNKNVLLDTQLYKLGIHCSDYFEDLSYLPKTLGELLLYLSDNDNLSKLKNKEGLNKLISELKLPNIYFGMHKEEIDNLVVTDEMLVLLDEVINNVSLKQQLKNNENTIAYTSQIREENLCLEGQVKASASKVNEQNNEVISQIKENIAEDKEQIEAKKVLLLELQKLSKEKQKLVEMNNQLDAEINQIMVNMYGAFEYAKRK